VESAEIMGKHRPRSQEVKTWKKTRRTSSGTKAVEPQLPMLARELKMLAIITIIEK